jgi:large subunit ribosomal protein L10
MKREEKEEIVAEVTEIARRSSGLFFTDFTGLTVDQVTELRREFRKSGIQYRVAKNTLIRKALESIGGYDAVFDRLAGPTGVAFAFEDPIAPAKIIQKFSDKHNKLTLKICVIEKQVYDGSRLADLAKMPSRKEIIASLLGTFQAPVVAIPSLINSLLGDVVSVIGEVERKKAA